ncbi:hypothetical protein FMUND_3807 [Fusarium mundagurra]|uniref:Uncharacterized protein n=1 Tax=Fusarium mundagurra TaxID=1567541 RepID=A0A8H5YYN4_9HYPO|nr:hypothetical protein FMUND_3807 [Fusarium mundagurra]
MSPLQNRGRSAATGLEDRTKAFRVTDHKWVNGHLRHRVHWAGQRAERSTWRYGEANVDRNPGIWFIGMREAVKYHREAKLIMPSVMRRLVKAQGLKHGQDYIFLHDLPKAWLKTDDEHPIPTHLLSRSSPTMSEIEGIVASRAVIAMDVTEPDPHESRDGNKPAFDIKRPKPILQIRDNLLYCTFSRCSRRAPSSGSSQRMSPSFRSPEGRADLISLNQEPNTSTPTASDAAGSSTAAQSPPPMQSSAQASAEGDAVPAPADTEGLWCVSCFLNSIHDLMRADMLSCEGSTGCGNCRMMKGECQAMGGIMVPIARQLSAACLELEFAATDEQRAKAQHELLILKLKAIGEFRVAIREAADKVFNP